MAPTRSHWPLSLLGGATSLLNLALPLVLVRLLPAEQIGYYKIFFLYLVLVPWFLMTAGLLNGLSHWAGRKSQALEAFRVTWTLLLIAAGVVTLAGLALSPWLARALDWPLEHTILFALCSFFTIASTFYEEASVARGDIWKGALFSSAFEFAKNVAVLVAALVARDIGPVFYAYSIVLLVKLALGQALGWRAGYQRLTSVLSSVLRPQILKYAMPVSVSALFQVCTNYIDQLALSKWIPAGEFAVYSLGCMIIPPLMIFEQSVNRVLIPGLSSAFHENEPDQAAAAHLQAVRELSWIFIPAALGMIVYAKPIVLMLFTAKFINSVRFFQVHALSYLLMIIPVDVVARAQGQGGWIFRNLSFFALLSLAVTLGMVNLYGPMGVLGGMLIVHALMRAVTVRWVSRTNGWALSKFIPGAAIARFLAYSVLLSCTAWGVRPFFASELGWFLTTSPVFFAAYMLITREEIPSKWRRKLRV